MDWFQDVLKVPMKCMPGADDDVRLGALRAPWRIQNLLQKVRSAHLQIERHIYIYIYMYIHVYIHLYIYIHVTMYIHSHTYIHVHTILVTAALRLIKSLDIKLVS